MAYTDIDDPSAYFQIKIYTGNGANNRALTFDGNSDLQPDWLWIKNRSETQSHALFDSVRGATKRLGSNSTGAESTENTNLDSFDSDGFTVDSELIVNGGSDLMVAWAWKAGTSFTNDASSTSVGSIDSAGSVNTDAGFAILAYEGTGSAATIAHGLGVVPKMIITKNRDAGQNWVTYHHSIGSTHALFLDNTDAKTDAASYFNDTNPTSSVYTVNTSGDNNKSGDSHIAYVFAEKQGYSKFGSYTGNGNANGPFIYTGFKTAMVIIKRIDDADNWVIYDNKRDGFNGDTHALFPNNSDAQTTDVDIDLLSNGFKIVRASGRVNASGGSFIYIAFAENPFVTSTGVPATAR